jgi:hypothetical protein
MPTADRTPISPPRLTTVRAEALPAYISNGLVGLRVERQPLLGGSAIVSGYAGRSPNDGVEAFAPAPYPLYGDVRVNDTWLSAATTSARFIDIQHDFASGELRTRWRYEVEGVDLELDHLVFCSRSQPTLVVGELVVRTDRPARLAVRAGLDPGRAPGRRLAAPPLEEAGGETADALVRWQSLGEISELGVAYATEWVGPEASPSVRLEDERGAISTTWSPARTIDGEVRLRTIASFVPSYSHHDPDHEAARLAANGRSRGFDRLRAENRAAWDELWRARIRLGNAATRWQAVTDASLYYLLSSVHRSTPASTSLFGLAYWPNYHYYHGHQMWDLDTFVIPPLSVLEPDAARALLDFRARTLNAARQNAALNGQAGALYPWEASPTRGEEATPKYAPLLKNHVTLDVALGALRYVQATGDGKFAAEHGREMVMAVAEWAASRAEATRRGYEITHVTGPAEAKEPVNNDAWTNAAAKLVLRAASRLARDAGIKPPDDWAIVADGLVLPIEAGSRRLLNHDGYRLDEEKGGTPEGAGAIWPLGWQAPPDVEAATFAFAVDEQAPRYLGTPMMSSLFTVWAARLGRRAEALDLLERGYGQFVDDPFAAPDEFPVHERDNPRANPMFANLGGYVTDLLFGFPDVELSDGTPESWIAGPTCLPDGWHDVSVDRLWVRGSPARLEARHGDRARLILEPAEGDSQRSPEQDAA